jgi:hypothetical protein
MKQILSFLVCILCVALKSHVYANELLTVFGRSNNIASIKIGTSSYRYNLYHQVDGYKFNCAKDRVLLWGLAVNKKFNESPDFNIERKISYIDLKYKKPKSVTSIGTGVLAVDFLKNKKQL